ncbi:MAG: sporulation protein YabP [Lachnospiraceae bacterium]
MEENRGMVKNHRAVLSNRRGIALTGVVDVISFDLGEVLLETELGMLHIKGKDLHVNRLNVEKGEVDVEGTLDSLTYTDTSVYETRGQGVFGRLFG